jgi:hypothetical protein
MAPPADGITLQPEQPEPVRRSLLWFGAFGGAAAWSVQLLSCVALGAGTCLSSGNVVPEFGGTWWALVVISGVALFVGLAATGTAARSLLRAQAARAVEPPALGSRASRARFMAFGGLLLDGVFVIGLVFNTLPLFMVPVCR